MSIFAPLQLLADYITVHILSVPEGSRGAEVMSYFLFDTAKILILLVVIIFIVSLIRSFFPVHRVKEILSRQHTITGHVAAGLLGIVTPFCSCSAVPLFLGFVEAGVPLGITFTFLVASPMINEIALVMLISLFGWKVSLLYIVSGLLISIIAGMIIGKLKLESLVVNVGAGAEKSSVNYDRWSDRLRFAWRYTRMILGRVWIFVVMGVGVGAWIHGYVPTDLLAAYAGKGHWYAVPLAVLIGIPLYSNAAGVMPLVSALTEKGVAMGTALAFMMAVTALSLPEFMILRRVMKTRLIIIFASIVGIGILITGYLFNWVLG
jgi:uncharacterized membrane protein YraQ (UPF0718 family)